MITQEVTVAAASGLHARPASLLAAAADETGFEIEISVAGGEPADAASLLEVMSLGVKHGDVVTLSSTDDGAGAAIASLVALLERDLDAE